MHAPAHCRDMEGAGHCSEEARSDDTGFEGPMSAEGNKGEKRRESGLEPSKPNVAESSAQKGKEREEKEEGACSDKELDELLDC